MTISPPITSEAISALTRFKIFNLEYQVDTTIVNSYRAGCSNKINVFLSTESFALFAEYLLLKYVKAGWDITSNLNNLSYVFQPKYFIMEDRNHSIESVYFDLSTRQLTVLFTHGKVAEYRNSQLESLIYPINPKSISMATKSLSEDSILLEMWDGRQVEVTSKQLWNKYLEN